MIVDNTNEKLVKLPIDDSPDFGFHAAYLAYSKAWDENLGEGVRLELNKALLSLAKEKKDYSIFYSEIDQYRRNSEDNYRRKRLPRARKKSVWRRSEAKKLRISRHKK